MNGCQIGDDGGFVFYLLNWMQNQVQQHKKVKVPTFSFPSP